MIFDVKTLTHEQMPRLECNRLKAKLQQPQSGPAVNYSFRRFEFGLGGAHELGQHCPSKIENSLDHGQDKYFRLDLNQ